MLIIILKDQETSKPSHESRWKKFQQQPQPVWIVAVSISFAFYPSSLSELVGEVTRIDSYSDVLLSTNAYLH
jgi:hypothetical protein